MIKDNEMVEMVKYFYKNKVEKDLCLRDDKQFFDSFKALNPSILLITEFECDYGKLQRYLKCICNNVDHKDKVLYMLNRLKQF